jgi:hypothetical protein
MEHSIRLFGWSTLIISSLLLISSLSSLLWNPLSGQITQVMTMFPQLRQQMDVIEDMFQYNRIWSLYSVFYFAFVLYGASQFVRFKAIGCHLLELACWIGMLNALIDTSINYYLTAQIKKALSGSLGLGIPLLGSLTNFTLVLGFFLWIIPSIFIIRFLRKHELQTLMK